MDSPAASREFLLPRTSKTALVKRRTVGSDGSARGHLIPPLDWLRKRKKGAMRISSLQTSILVDAAHHPRILAEVAVDVQRPKTHPPAGYIMPPIPPWLWSGWPASFFADSATPASVVIIRPAMEAASCKAIRTTLAGSMMPLSNMSPYSPA